MEKKPKLVYQKNAEQVRNKIIIPKFFCEKWGYKYYMEIYEDYIKLIPISRKEK